MECHLKTIFDSKIEKRVAYVIAPWWIPLQTIIAEDEKQARENHQAVLDSGSFRVYTDGSGINNRIGAAAFAQLGLRNI